ncbi:helix-turn-helix domain-containing protein [Clostridium sp. SHJSY1]|uniref:helix-turn-helix domain-containing protein n=1 Tax=Clostridium sp. SHJSY1 TaxID=2942483 RepID=UPI0028748573|nr:helix-turn-helix transcriptional regulator [Clostridium sp. SHJSY1]MDS0524376.1 helix-turn-helix domain-containing protein [Clostridium sp. SHJSY1]
MTNNPINLNEIKLLKNNIYKEVSLNFVYNLKKIIQLEGTQKNLSKKIGISEDLLSKYKAGVAFPSIETLIYICKVYNINLNDLLHKTLSYSQLESNVNSIEPIGNIFRNKYYVYFFVTNTTKEGSIQEGIIDFKENEVSFQILHNNSVIKCFNGNFKTSDKLVFFEFSSEKDGMCYINMIKPNVNMKKYIGGIAILLLPSHANSKPCCQKILFSKDKIDREAFYKEMSDILNFNSHNNRFGNVKVSTYDDEKAFDFICSIVL